ncbi:hypothetical protein E8E13_010817 [Curvularia kusanoi]|uniref:Uncharacterized protein n=1 Tax=Curvularia kusanoi TaxID=90978 RepID=A0A9P4WEF2_CURKU|nr:hypothetical protein E8E13_010817 [Curvularia kusanoi]
MRRMELNLEFRVTSSLTVTMEVRGAMDLDQVRGTLLMKPSVVVIKVDEVYDNWSAPIRKLVVGNKYPTMPRGHNLDYPYCIMGNNPRGIYGPDPRDEGEVEYRRNMGFFFGGGRAGGGGGGGGSDYGGQGGHGRGGGYGGGGYWSDDEDDDEYGGGYEGGHAG